MLATKAVQQNYAPTDEIVELLERFRLMVNECIRIALEDNLTSLKALSLKAYGQLGGYDVLSYYKLCAISAATGILRNYRKASRKGRTSVIPYARKAILITCYGVKIEDRQLVLPTQFKQHTCIPLNPHTLEALSGCDLRSVTLTPGKLTISFRRDVEQLRPLGFIGVDRNLNNVAVAASGGGVIRYDLSTATLCKSIYRQVKSHLRRNDNRIRRQLYQKYGWKERCKVSQTLHRVSKAIITDAKTKHYGIVMERLTGLRSLYRRGNGHCNTYRARLNSWSFAELQRQIDYKARWEGLPVVYVEPHGTSAKCSICGHMLKPEKNRMLKCPSCGLKIDRDVNAARNIVARGLRFGPDGWAVEGMVEKPSQEVALKLDAHQSSHQTQT